VTPRHALPPDLGEQVARALEEDVGSGDLTAAMIPIDAIARATIVVREPAVLCGAAWVEETFSQLRPDIAIGWNFADGARCGTGDIVCTLEGNARTLLTGERTALNFLQTLSATATLTAEYCQAVAGTRTQILDTRKTLPGLRTAQKYAVRCGGGSNHRVGLYDAVLIKDNHIDGGGRTPAEAVRRARRKAPQAAFLEVEVRSLDQLREVLPAGPDIVMPDNFTPAALRKAVAVVRQSAIRNPQSAIPLVEASGGITLENVRAVARTGVDRIAVGALTHSAPALDLALKITR